MALKLRTKTPTACQEVHMALESPLGVIRISGCNVGVHEVKLRADAAPGPVDKEMQYECTVQPGPGPVPEPLKICTAWLNAYFSEPQRINELPLPPFHRPVFEKDSFTCRVLLTLLNRVKFGDSVSYKQLASLAGNEKAARAVGGALRSNPAPLLIPCHRVILSNGELGAFMGGQGNHLKKWLLAREGIVRAEVGGLKEPAKQQALKPI